MISFDSVPCSRPELAEIRREEEILMIGFNGVPVRRMAFQVVGREEDELATLSGHRAADWWPSDASLVV